MDAYIDYPNFCSYLNSMSNHNFNKCNDVLLNSFNLHFTFDKSLLSKAKKEIKRNFDIWARTATKNRNGKSSEWKVDFPNRPITPAIYQDLHDFELSSVYMLDGDDVQRFEEAGCLLVATKGKELEKMLNLQIASSFIPTKQYRIRDMRNWDLIGENSSPCTDIILVDQYLFAQSDLEYNVNSYALLEQLCKWAKNEIINIVIFTFRDYKDNEIRRDIPFKTIERNIKSRVKDLTGAEPNLTFVILPAQEQHDRTIVTNYKMFTSGDSFKYFRDGVNVSLCSHGEWMYVSSLVDSDILMQSREFLHDMQEVLDKVKDGVMSIIGDRKCNFLSFD